MDIENIENVWTEMRMHLIAMKVALKSLTDEEQEVLKEMAGEWFASNPL